MLLKASSPCTASNSLAQLLSSAETWGLEASGFGSVPKFAVPFWDPIIRIIVFWGLKLPFRVSRNMKVLGGFQQQSESDVS